MRLPYEGGEEGQQMDEHGKSGGSEEGFLCIIRGAQHSGPDRRRAGTGQGRASRRRSDSARGRTSTHARRMPGPRPRREVSGRPERAGRAHRAQAEAQGK